MFFVQNQEPVFSKDSTRFFLTVPVKQGGRGEFHHIAMFTTQVEVEFRHNFEITMWLVKDTS